MDACVKDATAIMLRMLAFTLVSALYFLSHTTEGAVVYACHNDTAVMSCESGFKIHLEYILYKVGVATRCGEGKRHPDDGEGVFCSFPWAEMVVEDLCANRRSCKVPVTETVFGEYPCQENTRYMEVAYACVAQAPPPPPAANKGKADCDDNTA
ncbi:D-galactoside-specific lectin-like isoform X1 [Festucalex cinctus]